MDKLRLRFEKTGRAIYISHLDLMHTMQRAFSRAGYELKYSEGFNPHPQISIALPLSVGAASLCEIMDFRLKTEIDLALLPKRLSQVLPEGIRITEAYEQTRKIAELKWLEVEGCFEYDDRDPALMAEKLRSLGKSAEADKVLEKFEKEGKHWFIPRALIPIAYEAWWQLQHCVDSYGCDYEWVFSDEGMHDILVDQQQCDIHWWGETEEDFKDYFEL